MQQDANYPFINASFGEPREIRTSTRYNWNSAKRGNDTYVILQWTRKGCGQFTFEGRTYPVRPQEAFISIVPEESRYAYPPHANEPWEFSWINFYGGLAVNLWQALRQRFGPVIPIAAGTPAALELKNLIDRAHRFRWKDRYENSAHSYQFYLTLWSQLATPRQTYKQDIREAASFLRAHYRERLRVKEAAAYAGMSREHFTRIFHQHYKMSPAAFLREERLKSAAKFLETTNLPVHEIAFRTGFYSHAQFGQLFRRRFKKTPLHYRRLKMKSQK